MKETIVCVNSENKKLGIGVSATYRPVGHTCPKSCPMLENGCYAQRGPTNFQQRRAKEIHADLDKVAAAGSRLLRLNVSGDFFGRGRFDKTYVKAILSFANRHKQIKIWGYTHAWKSFITSKLRHSARNLSILASVHSKAEAKTLHRKGWRTARVVENWDELLPGEAKCLNQTIGATCANCGICFSGHKNLKGVVFKRH